MSAPKITTEKLYEEHWRFVFQTLPTYGVFERADQDDLAQTVWQNVHAQIATYDPEREPPRAWITGFVRRCASNYRRTLRRRPEAPTDNLAEHTAAPGLNPEEYALLGTIEQSVSDKDQREAFVLHHRHGFTIDEVAAIMGTSKGRTEWRLQNAQEFLRTCKP